MPYNKGDFTQQGINGDVSALVRLNEKRVMKVVLSSDDESDNCDISGKVYDLLNGTSYDIGSGVSGNIEITENGENINVAPYATATVNVSGGGGDNVHYCTITLIPDNDSEIWLDERDSYIIENAVLMNPDSVIDSQTVLLSPHYSFIDKGDNTITYALFYPNNATLTATNEVNCTWDSLDNCIYITDNTLNSSITLSGYTPK